MFAKRIIPCLDCKDGRVVKGVRFVDLRDAGDPGALAEAYNRAGADELVMLDISASREGRATLIETVKQVARRLFIPLTVGGGVRSLEDAQRLLAAGADKVAVNTGAVEDPELVRQLASHYGRQAVVVAIDARRLPGSAGIPFASLRASLAANETAAGSRAPNPRSRTRWTVLTYGGTRETGLDALDWARQVDLLGAGEILLTSMDADGTQAGFDCELTATVSGAVRIPVIASGGAGIPEHFAEVFLRGAADAALAASVFHFEQYTILSLKEYLRSQGVPVRVA